MEHPQELSPEDRIWTEIDHQIVSLKVRKARVGFDENLQQRLREDSTGKSGGDLVSIRNRYLQGARQWTEIVFGIYCEVWLAKGNAKSPDFLRAVLTKSILPEIDQIALQVKYLIESIPLRSPVFFYITPEYKKFEFEAERLKNEWRTKIEIETLGLELEQSGESADKVRPPTVPGARGHSLVAGHLGEGIRQAESAEGPLVAGDDAIHGTTDLPTAESRRGAVATYIEEVNRSTGKIIRRKDIWTRAGYADGTEFERWVRNDRNKINRTADARFTRLLLVDKPHLK